MSLIHNERTKLTATFLNGLAIAFIAVGALAPVLAGGFRNPAIYVAQAAVCLVTAFALHFEARKLLGRLLP